MERHLDRVSVGVLRAQLDKRQKEAAREQVLANMGCENAEELLAKIKDETARQVAKDQKKNRMTPAVIKKNLPKSTAYCKCGKPILNPDALKACMADKRQKSQRIVPIMIDAACKCEGTAMEDFERRYERHKNPMGIKSPTETSDEDMAATASLAGQGEKVVFKARSKGATTLVADRMEEARKLQDMTDEEVTAAQLEDIMRRKAEMEEGAGD